MADKLMSLANWIVAGLIVVLAVKRPEAPLALALIGVVVFVGLYVFSVWLIGRSDQ
jgi:FtsH-binding integral membrane protein